ncbi:hypothetical protein J5X84_42915 [Streptosporangiaceae bacterium NEAU-GS5]|nr:hypothetical protein [Streptosporangiaceae bacterium NEAU-GS5]
MRFQIQFHGPFRVSTGGAHSGLDETFDPANPLPASSLKGLMRSNAKLLLRIGEQVLAEVYGSRERRSPWWWSDATLTQTMPAIRTRLTIDPATHTAKDTALVTSGELWAREGWFEVRHRDRVDPDRLDVHRAVLTASALAITALGADRRRGSGWVSVTSDDGWDQAMQELLGRARA